MHTVRFKEQRDRKGVSRTHTHTNTNEKNTNISQVHIGSTDRAREYTSSTRHAVVVMKVYIVVDTNCRRKYISRVVRVYVRHSLRLHSAQNQRLNDLYFLFGRQHHIHTNNVTVVLNGRFCRGAISWCLFVRVLLLILNEKKKNFIPKLFSVHTHTPTHSVSVRQALYHIGNGVCEHQFMYYTRELDANACYGFCFASEFAHVFFVC